jgi:tRNA U34 2-thiouridine synthase MnmA/TrmU
MVANSCKTPSNNRIKRPKALALLSGGLDSMLAVKLILEQGIDVEVVNFDTPFYRCDHCAINRFADELKLKVHSVFLAEALLEIVVNPLHGYGSQMNPCIDCRILMFKKAKELAEEICADFIVTGEVLNERPLSQREETMLLIDKEAGVEGKILRPLSAKLLPETEPEKKGQVDRDRLLALSGRRRLPQIELAKKLDLKSYPNPSGGCLLTDPRFAQRLREHLKNEKNLTVEDAELLTVGRHFRMDGAKIIVGRNEEENNRLLTIAKNRRIPYLEAADYTGPIALYVGEDSPDLREKAAAITVRYSDAPKDAPANVIFRVGTEKIVEMEARSIGEEELDAIRI